MSKKHNRNAVAETVETEVAETEEVEETVVEAVDDDAAPAPALTVEQKRQVVRAWRQARASRSRVEQALLEAKKAESDAVKAMQDAEIKGTVVLDGITDFINPVKAPKGPYYVNRGEREHVVTTL